MLLYNDTLYNMRKSKKCITKVSSKVSIITIMVVIIRTKLRNFSQRISYVSDNEL